MNKPSLETILVPAEFGQLPKRDLSSSICVVFDVLRATSAMTVALANGARAILPVVEIEEAIAATGKYADPLLAGERHGFKITAGKISFDLGNSPREFTMEKVNGRTIVTTTTNGTRALRACMGAEQTFVASFLNLGATAKVLNGFKNKSILLVCGGTYEEASFEDTLAAGALAHLIGEGVHEWSDSTHLAAQVYERHASDLFGAMKSARNGRRLLEIPELRDDVAFSLQRDIFDFAAVMGKDGMVRKLS
ncbi:MAG: 2-phosphosulfolactate phosphatase [Verrucomicrobiota bacterium]|nr:2-phosphosulfolactate phosphatase [Verrucomicrobiota bacterium]